MGERAARTTVGPVGRKAPGGRVHIARSAADVERWTIGAARRALMRWGVSHRALASAGLAIAAVASGVAAPAMASAEGGGAQRVVIRRTPHGVPHIEASSYRGLGRGYGYAFAQDNICTIAEDYVTVNAERSRWFGPRGTSRRLAGESRNLDSDFFWRQIIDSHVVERLLRRRPPRGQSVAARELMRGYVAGYNAYLKRVGGARGVTDPTCRGKAWVRPITTATAYRRLFQVAMALGGDSVIEEIARARPPRRGRQAGRQGSGGLTGARTGPTSGGGSNAIAVGRDGVRDHRHGLLLGNPHLPWQGTDRFYQAQLTIPGRLDVQGASLYGVPAIQIGYTRRVAWSHTTAPGLGFTLYRLRLAKGSPTSYVVDGRRERMTSRRVSVRARGRDGRLRRVRRRLWSTRWGPVVTGGRGLGGLAWTSSTAFVFADAAATNVQALDTWLAIARARSAAGVLRALRRWQGLPWNDTLVAGRAGRALYADIRVAPDVSDALARRCNVDVGQPPFAASGLAVLDGSRSACRWGRDPRAVEPGRSAAARQPHLFRRDYVTNSNDSYWLSNPHEPLEGFPRIAGDERAPRSLRTRIGLLMTQARVAGTDGLGTAGFTRVDMQQLVFSNRQYAGELTRDALVGICRALPAGLAPTSAGTTVAVGAACDVLAAWDLRENLDSRGAILFRRFWDNLYQVNEPDSWWVRPFDASDPISTPSGLNAATPGVAVALGDAIADLNTAHVPLDVAVRDVQRVVRGGRRIPIHGGPGDPHGQFNAIESGFVPGRGFGEVEGGSSYVEVVTWHDGPCPDAATILTYSQSTNPRSRYFADQGPLFSRKQWVPARFCRDDVLRHTLTTTVLPARP
jgi:acyl-homoserine-lactone acylase